MAQQDCPRPLFDPLVNRLIRDAARRVITVAALPGAELPDIEQDLRLHLWTQRDAYRAERGARSTFAKVVIQRKAAAIAIRYRAKCRFGTYVPIDDYLDTMKEGDDNRGGRPSHGMDASRDVFDRLNRRVDVRRALQRLAKPDRAIATQLMSARVTEIAEEEGIPRSTIYESIKRIRRQFIDSGLGAGPRAVRTVCRSSE
jgi:DNA-directed RNA polymerase specialized sigma24 family protein